MLDLTPNELSWMIKHLGHTLDVHNVHYRCMESVIEKAKVPRLLLLSIEGKLGQWAGHSLQDILSESKSFVIPAGRNKWAHFVY